MNSIELHNYWRKALLTIEENVSVMNELLVIVESARETAERMRDRVEPLDLDRRRHWVE